MNLVRFPFSLMPTRHTQDSILFLKIFYCVRSPQVLSFQIRGKDQELILLVGSLREYMVLSGLEGMSRSEPL